MSDKTKTLEMWDAIVHELLMEVGWPEWAVDGDSERHCTHVRAIVEIAAMRIGATHIVRSQPIDSQYQMLKIIKRYVRNTISKCTVCCNILQYKTVDPPAYELVKIFDDPQLVASCRKFVGQELKVVS